MPVKIRLQRHGRKGKPYFHIVVADARAPRDGRYIERLGFYNPNTNPATIDLDVDGAVKWLGNGAQPTDTARAILSYKGVLYKNHLLKGVKKGALTEEEAEKRFNAWLEEKIEKIEQKKKGLSEAARKDAEERLQAETEVNKARAAAYAAAQAPPVEEAPAEEESPAAEGDAPAVEAQAEEAPAAEAEAEAPAAEEPKAEAAEAKAEEAPAAEEPKAEAAEAKAEEAPAEEAKAEEAKPEEAKAEEAPAEEAKVEAKPEEAKAEAEAEKAEAAESTAEEADKKKED